MVERVNLFARQLGIGEALAVDAGHSSNEAVGIGDTFCWLLAAAMVETKHLFVKVTIKMEWFDRHIGSAKVALEQAPEIFKAVRVNLSLHVPVRVVHPIVNVAILERVIGYCAVRVYLAHHT